MIRSILRPLMLAAAIVGAVSPAMAQARVMVVFHSFTGALFYGRYPHTFIELTGTLDSNGRPVHENYGYTAVKADYDVALGKTVPGKIMVEEERYLKSTNIHFAVPISDDQYFAILKEVERWNSGPESAYNLETHNCVNFVAKIAEIVGLKSEVPANLEKHPKAWLNYLTRLNPQLHARPLN
jgi:hypothetical protein